MVGVIAEHIKTHRHQLRKHSLFIGSAVTIPPHDRQVDRAIQAISLDHAGSRVAHLDEEERAAAAIDIFATEVADHAERCRLLAEALGDNLRPAEGHVRLSRLIKDGYYSSVFISEPDDMLERALAAQHMDLGKDYHLLVAGIDDPKDIHIAIEESSRIAIVKCGGDLEQKFLPISPSEVAAVAESISGTLDTSFKLFSVMVAMSEREDPLLARIPRDGGKIFWINRMIPMADAEMFDELKLENPASADFHRYQPHVMSLLEARHSSRHLLCREPGTFNDFFAKLHGRLVRRGRGSRRGRRDLTVMRGGPYQFLDYFDTEDEDFYFGREEDVAAVVERIDKAPITVVFGKAAMGKTSLLRAGIIPKLRQQTEDEDKEQTRPWLLAYTRVGEDPRESIRTAILTAVEETGHDTSGLRDLGSCAQLVTHTVQLTGRRVLVMLDQFAEYFVKLGRRGKRRAVAGMREILEHCDDDFRLLIAVREDYLGELYELESAFPEILHNMHRLRPLSRQQAEDAISKPAQNFDLQVERSLTRRIVDDLFREGVDPHRLQIVMHSLYESLSPGGRTITERTYDRLGGARQILPQYLERALIKLPGIEKRTAQKVLVFLALGSELKASQPLERIQDEVGAEREIVERSLAHLVDLGLLRPVGRGRDREYELIHEVLADQIERDLGGTQVMLRDIQDLLTRELNSFQQFGLLMGREELKLLATVRDDIIVGPEELRLIIRSALTQQVDEEYWFGRVWELRDGKTEFVSRLMRDDEPHVRLHVFRSLSDHLEARLIRHLVHGLDDTEAEVRELAVTYLGQMDRHLLSMLENRDHRVRAIAARALGAIGDRRFIKHLVDAFADGDVALRDEIVTAILDIGDPRTQETLLRGVTSGSSPSWAAAYALGRMSGGEDELNGLNQALRSHPTPQLRYAMGLALIQRRSFDEAEEALLALREQVRGQEGTAAVAEAIEYLQTERARASAGEDSWPMFGRYPCHGAATDQEVVPPLEVAWEFKTEDQVMASPVVREHTVYIGSRDRRLYAVDSVKGAERWRFQAGDRIEGAAAVSEDIVCFGALGGNVYGLDPVTGAQRWKTSLGASIRASCTMDGDSVYIGTRSGKLARLSIEDGHVVWERSLPGEISASASVCEGTAVIGCWEGSVVAWDTHSGEEVWRHRIQAPVPAGSAIADGVVYIGSDADCIEALNLADGSLLWSARLGGHIRSCPALSAELVIVGCLDGKCYGLSRETGEIAWRTPTEEEILGSPGLSGELVYVGSKDGALYALQAATGEVVWTHKTAYGIYSAPAIAEQTVFAGIGYYGVSALRPVAHGPGKRP